MNPLIETHENCKFDLYFELNEDDGTPINLAGCVARFDLRSGRPDNTPAIVLPIRSNGANPILTLTGNVISGQLTAAQLSRNNVPAGRYFAELVVTFGDGQPDFVARFDWRHYATGEGKS